MGSTLQRWGIRLGLLGLALAALTLAPVIDSPRDGPEAPAHPASRLQTARLLEVAQDPTAGEIRPTQLALDPGNVGNVTWEPTIIFNDGVETATVTLPIAGGDFGSVFVTAEGVLTPDSTLPSSVSALAEDLVQLYDDGTHGDATAGDGAYTRSGITATGTLTHDGGTHQRLANKAFFFRSGPGGSAEALTLSLETGLSIVDASQRGTVTVTDLGANITATSHAIFLVDDGSVFPNYPQVDADTAVNVCVGCEVLIESFGDIFDFIVLQTREVVDEPLRSIRQAFFSPTFNDVGGIGLEPRDLNGGPGFFTDGTPFNTFSAGRLQGIIFDNVVDGSPLSHEVMHRWSAFAAQSLGWLDGIGHFIANSDVNGIMDLELTDSSGFIVSRDDAPFLPTDLIANGDGTFRLQARPGEFNATFAPISLYLAGFIPSTQVSPTQLLGGTIDLSDPGRVTATSVTELTIADVLALEGSRVPSSATAPTNFTVGTIVISDRPYREADYTFITLALRYWESDKAYDGSGAPPWQAATLGQSTITVALPGLEEPVAGAAAITASDFTIEVGETTEITVTVTDQRGDPFEGALVEFSQQTGTVPGLRATTATSDANGEATVIFDAVEPGTFRIEAVVTDGGALVSLNITVLEVGALQTRTVSLLPGWNFVAWTGDTTAVADAVAGIVAPAGADLTFFAWDAAQLQFRTFNASLPPFVNSLTEFAPGEAIWVLVVASGTASWEQPITVGARLVPLSSGFNMVSWTGPDATPVDVVLDIQTATVRVFAWDTAAQRFLRFDPAQPAFLSDLAVLDFGTALWIDVFNAAIWDQPAP